MASADRFAKVVRDLKVEIDKQKLVAETIVKEKRLGERSMYDVAETLGWQRRGTKSGDAEYCDERLVKATRAINKAIKEVQAFEYGFRQIFFQFQAGGLAKTTKADISPDTLDKFNRSVNRLSEQVKKFGELLKERGS
jgi:hypothetical protein